MHTWIVTNTIVMGKKSKVIFIARLFEFLDQDLTLTNTTAIADGHQIISNLFSITAMYINQIN